MLKHKASLTLDLPATLGLLSTKLNLNKEQTYKWTISNNAWKDKYGWV